MNYLLQRESFRLLIIIQLSMRLPCLGAKHIFSHVEWHMTGYAISLEETENMDQEGLLFVDVKETEKGYFVTMEFDE